MSNDNKYGLTEITVWL